MLLGQVDDKTKVKDEEAEETKPEAELLKVEVSLPCF
jgi:hypothetical protein